MNIGPVPFSTCHNDLWRQVIELLQLQQTNEQQPAAVQSGGDTDVQFSAAAMATAATATVCGRRLVLTPDTHRPARLPRLIDTRTDFGKT